MKIDLGLLVLRVALGSMMAGHGLGKAMDVVAGRFQFADPLGIGPGPTLVLAAFAEFLCAVAVILGFRVRWAVVPIVLTMLVAGFVVHAGDPWADKELAFVYAAGFLALFFTGSGRYSLDIRLKRGRR